MKSAGKARNNGLYRHIRTSKEIIRNLLNDFYKYFKEMFQRFVIKVKKKQQKNLVKKTANNQIIRLLLIKGE